MEPVFRLVQMVLMLILTENAMLVNLPALPVLHRTFAQDASMLIS